MDKFSTTKLLRKPKDVFDVATVRPVLLTVHGHDAFVLLNAAEYRYLAEKANRND